MNLASTRFFLAALAALVVVLCAAPGEAEAQRRRGGFGGQPAARTFGIGLILGSPTGLSGELRLSPRTALDFAIGIDSFDDDDGFDDDDSYVHIDYLAYLTDLGRGGSLSVPLYVGVGAVFWDHGRGFDDDLHLGVRVPFGLALALRRAPVQFFFELALRVLLVDQDHGHDDLDLDGAIGFRVYF